MLRIGAEIRPSRQCNVAVTVNVHWISVSVLEMINSPPVEHVRQDDLEEGPLSDECTAPVRIHGVIVTHVLIRQNYRETAINKLNAVKKYNVVLCTHKVFPLLDYRIRFTVAERLSYFRISTKCRYSQKWGGIHLGLMVKIIGSCPCHFYLFSIKILLKNK